MVWENYEADLRTQRASMKILLLFLFLISTPVFCAPAIGMSSCKEFVEIYCKSESMKENQKGLLLCLSEHKDKLSDSCKQEIERFAKTLSQTTPPGGGPMGMLGGMTGLAGRVPLLSYEGRTSHSWKGEGPALNENQLKLSLPIFKAERDSISSSFNLGNLEMDEVVTLDSGMKVPRSLYRTDVGLQYSRRLKGEKTLGFQGSYGYTGDKFTSNTASYNLTANYSYPGSDQGHWVLMLLMSNNGPFGAGVPIPGFFYIHRTPTFTGVFGLPIASVQWTPVTPWSFSLSALGPLIKTEISHGTIDEIQIFGGASWAQQRFILDEREEQNDRLTFEEKKIEGGIRKPLSTSTMLDLRLGHSFNRTFYVGKGLFDKEGGNENLPSAWYVNYSVRIVF